MIDASKASNDEALEKEYRGGFTRTRWC